MKSIPTFTLAFAFAIAHKLYSNYVFKLSPYVVTAFAVFLLSFFIGMCRKAVFAVGCLPPQASRPELHGQAVYPRAGLSA